MTCKIGFTIITIALVAGLLVGCGSPAELPTAPEPTPEPAPKPEPPKEDPKTEPGAEPTLVEGDVEFELTSVTNPAWRMGELIVIAKTEPGTEASIQMWFESGRESLITFRDKDKATADSAGKLVFDGKLGPIHEGIAKIEITLNKDGRSGKATVFTEIKRPITEPAPPTTTEPAPATGTETAGMPSYDLDPLLPLAFFSIPDSIKIGSGDVVTVVMQTRPEDQRSADIKCEIKVTLSDGTVSNVPQETTQNADAAGQTTWTWEVPPGTLAGDTEVLVEAVLGIHQSSAKTKITYLAGEPGPDVPQHKAFYLGEPIFKLRFAEVPNYIEIGSGTTATVTVQTLPLSERRADIICTIKVKLSDDTYISVADDSQKADDAGQVSWSWEVPAGTVLGETTIYVTAEIIGMPSVGTARTGITYLE